MRVLFPHVLLCPMNADQYVFFFVVVVVVVVDDDIAVDMIVAYDLHNTNKLPIFLSTIHTSHLK